MALPHLTMEVKPMEKMTPEQFLAINEKLKEAEKDDTPYPVLNDGNVYVVGDPNKTETKKHDYTVRFRYPRSFEPYFENIKGADVIGNYVMVDVEYKDVHVAPINDIKVTTGIANMQPFYKKLEENGDISDYTEDEMMKLLEDLDNEILASMYQIVRAFLNIDEQASYYITIPCVLDLVVKFIEDFPETFNEADAVFGLSTETQS